jgi:hypothetical protein
MQTTCRILVSISMVYCNGFAWLRDNNLRCFNLYWLLIGNQNKDCFAEVLYISDRQMVLTGVNLAEDLTCAASLSQAFMT